MQHELPADWSRELAYSLLQNALTSGAHCALPPGFCERLRRIEEQASAGLLGTRVHVGTCFSCVAYERVRRRPLRLGSQNLTLRGIHQTEQMRKHTWAISFLLKEIVTPEP